MDTGYFSVMWETRIKLGNCSLESLITVSGRKVTEWQKGE
jgi:hypothetical protein